MSSDTPLVLLPPREGDMRKPADLIKVAENREPFAFSPPTSDGEKPHKSNFRKVVKKMNSVSIVGRLTKNPELRFTSKGTAVANFRLARNERAGEKEQPLFIDVTVWNKQAEVVVQHKKQGDQVAVSGRLEYSEFTDSEGRKQSRIRIVAHHVEFLARKNGNGHDTDAEPIHTESPAAAVADVLEEEIPF